MPDNDRRLIEVAFPLKQASLNSVHEKNVRHGHISTLHIWPARRPLAACRAALIATLLPDPGTEEERKKLVERIGGRVVEKVDKDGNVKEVTEGGVLHWGQEQSPDMDWFRAKIREAYGGRAPRVLDPFAGGGAIPLEAMRLGCETTAIDINPVAWFILKCTLEYPQKLAGQTCPLPDFAFRSRDFMETYFKRTGKYTKKQLQQKLDALQGELFDNSSASGMQPPEVDLSWHVRAWGHWVLEQARKDLADFYPTYAAFETVAKRPERKKDEICRVPHRLDGSLYVKALNAEFTKKYLAKKENPRWVAKPTVTFLWTRTVPCKSCRAIVPLLKTTWLAKRGKKRVCLIVEPNNDKTGVCFGILKDVSEEKTNKFGAGNMSRSGAKCLCCPTIMTMQDIRAEGTAGRLSSQIMAVVVEGQGGKEYRLPTQVELEAVDQADNDLLSVFNDVPFGLPEEKLAKERIQGNSGFRVLLYGLDTWDKLFVSRQLISLATFVKCTREIGQEMLSSGYPEEWIEAVSAYLAIAVDRLADAGSTIAHWQSGSEFNVNTFQRFALPMSWDFSEVNFCSSSTGSYDGAVRWIALTVEHFLGATESASHPKVIHDSVIAMNETEQFDAIVTDPPYYDAIAYSDVMDFFYVWLRRTLHGLSSEIRTAFGNPSGPKWDDVEKDGELIDDAGRFGGDSTKSKKIYEDGMARAFSSCHDALKPDGRLVIVFASKAPDAWEALVSAIIRAGFVVDGSWPIQTEREARTNAISTASLASSIWLVCKKRPRTMRPGWDTAVLREMREKITDQLRAFWDAGIRGPDFVWAATGPAMEAYSKYPAVRKANEPGLMSVAEFLRHVRREVVDFAVGRVLSPGGSSDSAAGLDDVTAYYLLHRNDYGLEKVPMGACILYALSCGLSDSDLTGRLDLLVQEKNEARLKSWKARKHPRMGYEAPGGVIPLIDQVHRLMHLWKAGDVKLVNEYIDEHGLRKSAIFIQVLQALIELSGNDERATLESISNHLKAQGVRFESGQIEAFTS